MNAIAIDKARRLDIYTRKDGTFHKEFLVLDANGDPYDFTGHTIRWKVFSKIRTNPALIVDIGNHLTVETGKFTIDVPPEEMDFRKEDNYHQLWVENDEGTYVWLNGKFVVNNFNLFDGINAITGVAMTIGDQNVTIIIGGNTGAPPLPTDTYWADIKGQPSSNQSLTTYINSLIDDAGAASYDFNGGVSESGGVVRWGGTGLDADVMIPAEGHGVQFGQDGSELSFFNMFGGNFEFEIDQTVARMQHNGGFTFQGTTSGAKLTMMGFDGVGIGTDTPDGSAILDLASTNKALLLSRLQALSAVGVPRDGMVAWSDEFNDVVARVAGQWSPLTRAKVVPTADVNITLNETYRNKVIVMTGNGALSVTLPATGLAADFTCFVMLSEDSADGTTIQLIPQLTSGPDATLNAFNDTIYAGGASIIQAQPGTYYASGSLGPFVDSADIYAAIADALEDAEDYTDGVAAGLQIQVDALKNLPVATEVTATGTLALTQANKLLPINVATGNTQTVPTNATVAFPIGTVILLQQVGAGQVTIAAAGGVTIQSSGTKLKLSAQYAVASLVKKDTNVWALSGDLSA